MGQGRKKGHALEPAPAARKSNVVELDEAARESEDRADLGRGLSGKVMFVTPKIASRWLTRLHQEQRNVAHGRVAALTRDITNDAFKLTHQAVAFDGSGSLIDGQHRLLGIVQANKGVHLLVIWNESAEFKDPIDRNLPRSLGFIAQRSNREVAALSCLRDLESGYEVKSTMSVADVLQMWEKYGPTLESIREATSVKGAVGGMVAAYVWTYPIDPAKVVEFVSKVTTGEMIQRGDPAFAIRRWREAQSSYSQPSWKTAMATLACLRAHIAGEQQLTVYPDSAAGYRTLTARRRALSIPNTPGPDVVPAR